MSPGSPSISGIGSTRPTLGRLMSATTSVRPDESTRRAAHFGLAVLALAMGGFAIGTTEFVTMGLLPQIADGRRGRRSRRGPPHLGVRRRGRRRRPAAGLLGARLPRRGLLLALMAAFALAQRAVSALAPGIGLLSCRPVPRRPAARCLLRRRLAGGRRAWPPPSARAARSPGDARGCRSPTSSACRRRPGSARTSAGARRSSSVGAARPCSPSCWSGVRARRAPATRRAPGGASSRPSPSAQVWLTLLVGAIGFGGMFAVYTYIAPTVTEVGGLPAAAVPLFLLSFGLGMVVGTWLAGELADWSVLRLAARRGGRDGRGAAPASPPWRRTAGGPLPVAFLSRWPARCWW